MGKDTIYDLDQIRPNDEKGLKIFIRDNKLFLRWVCPHCDKVQESEFDPQELLSGSVEFECQQDKESCWFSSPKGTYYSDF